MNHFAIALFGCLRLLAGTTALCFVAAMPVSLDLATAAFAKLC